MVCTLSGSVRSPFRFLQPLKALSPILRTFFPNLIVLQAVHGKAFRPICVIWSPITIV